MRRKKISVVLDQKDSLYFERRIVRCDDCGLLFVNPQPAEEELRVLYDGELSGGGRAMFWDRRKKKYVVHESDAKNEKGAQKTALEKPPAGKPGPVERRAGHRMRVIRKLAPPPRRVLDIGCNDGCFLLAAKENGYQGEGIEISSTLAEIARRKTGFDVFCGTMEQYVESGNRRSFDVVTLWDVVEHLLDPKATLKVINGLQDSNGILGISTVNLMNYRYLRYGEKWRGFRESQEHIIFFSHQTLSMLLEKCGYKTIRIVTRMIPAFHLKWLNMFKLGNVLEIYARKTEDA